MEKIYKIEIGAEENDTENRKIWGAIYRTVTVTYYPAGYDDNTTSCCGEIYPSGSYDDRLGDMLRGGVVAKLGIRLDYTIPQGVVYKSPQSVSDYIQERDAKIKKNQEEIAENNENEIRAGLCPKCHSYCYGDCED